MKNPKLIKKQSLGYQIRTILMHQHYLSRFEKQEIGISNGGDELEVFNDDFDNLVYFIYEKITENYKIKLSGLSKTDILDYIIFLLRSMEKDYFSVDIFKDKLVFKMGQDGYRYQFNGYINSEDKRNLENSRLTKWIMWFTGITTFYYIGSWFIKDLDFIKFREYINITFNSINIVYLEISKLILLTIINIILIKSIANYLENKIDNI